MWRNASKSSGSLRSIRPNGRVAAPHELHISAAVLTSKWMWERVRGHLRALGDEDTETGWLWFAVVAVVVLNMADATFTLWWVHTGIATEANALLADLVESNAVGFALAKSTLVSLGLLLLWRQRRRPLASFGIGLAFVAYNLLAVYHLGIAALAVERALV